MTNLAVENGDTIPGKYTCDGSDISPLRWNVVQEGTRSTGLICDDPDAPMGTFVHWVLFNLPPAIGELRNTTYRMLSTM
jgi:Raf kinase inhibitor-like YbhB/YbcL family protein